MTGGATNTTNRRTVPTHSMIHRKGRNMAHKMVYIAAAAAFSTSARTHAWLITDMSSSIMNQHRHHNRFEYGEHAHRTFGSPSPLFVMSPCVAARSSLPPWNISEPTKRTRTTRLYSSKIRQQFNKGDDDGKSNELFGFRRAAKRAARKILPTKWFGTKEEKAALVRKQEVKDRVRGELDQMLSGAPVPVKMFGKYVVAPLMGKIASAAVEAGRQQQDAMETVLDEARKILLNDPEMVGLLGTPIQIGTPFSQRSSTTVINGRRQMRMEFAVEISGPLGNGMSRIVATNEGIGGLLVESNGRVYNIDLTSKGTMSSASPSRSSGASFGGDENVIEAEIIEKETD